MTMTVSPKAPRVGRESMSVRTGMIPFEAEQPKTDMTASATPEPVRQIDTSEAPSVEATPTEPTLSPKFAEIARREKWLRAQRQELEKEKQALKAKEAEYANGYLSKDTLKQRLTQDLWGFLAENGVTQDQMLNAGINGQAAHDPELMNLRSEVTQLRATLEQFQKQSEESKTTAYQNALKDIRRDAENLVKTDARFETIKESDKIDAVVDLIKETYEQQGIVLGVEEAAEQIENALVEEFAKIATFKKVRERLTPAAPAETEQKVVAKEPVTKTLTHAHSAQTPKRLTEQERIERAKLAFRGQL